ncbi:hypothetical protein AA309_18685 [Microvirga vignae]|uniref:Uncharacterized protein n=1 Tax=Microvirga vignae TaxID=1225564 RepID=A0A0H1RGG8_9HYPH|nr:hypothetical protein AA309_18685 [Microvirga vignae]
MDDFHLLTRQRHSVVLAQEKHQIHHCRWQSPDELLPGSCSRNLEIFGPGQCDRQRLILAQRTIGKLLKVTLEALFSRSRGIVVTTEPGFLPNPLLA